MIKFSLYALAPVAALLSASAVNAQNYAGGCAQCQASCGPTHMQTQHDTFYVNQMWPRQYMAPARRGICQSFDLMIANGWRRNNLLGKYDFDPKDGGLSEAGRLRVEWILTQAPPHRRTIFVQRGLDQQQTSQRVEAVQSLAAAMYPGTGPAEVQESTMQDYGRPATAVDAVFTGFGANQPPPMLPVSSSTSSDSGS